MQQVEHLRSHSSNGLTRRVARAFAIAAASVLMLVGGGGADAQNTAGPVWPQARSDMAPDPAVTFGTLPNGLRYAIMRNATPPGQVSMRLRIDAGSAHEARDQEGLAHFLEHLAFRGSTRVADGEAFRMLERLGLALGADTNASTGALETVYQFDLPRNDEESLSTGVMLLREIAGNLSLTQAAMDAERGVILAEERARDDAALHFGLAQQALLFGDHPAARSPIGRTEVIRTAPVSRVRDFYHAYYRPERAVLVIAGDIEPAAVEARVKTAFSDWRAQGPAGRDIEPLKMPAPGLQVRLQVEAGLTVQTAISWLTPYVDEPPSRAVAVRRQREGLAVVALINRLSALGQQPNAPFLAALAVPADTVGVANSMRMVALAPRDWKASLEAMIQAQRQAVQYGLRQDELDRAIATARTSLQNTVAGAGTRRTPQLAAELLTSVSSKGVFLSPPQRQAVVQEAIEGLTLAEANLLLRNRFSGAGPLVLVASPTPIEGGVSSVEATMTAALAAPVAPLARAEVKPWPYADFGAAGAVVERREDAALETTFVTFANGVRVAIKPTRFASNQIQVRAKFGNGRLDMSTDRPIPAADLWAAALVDGGLEGLSTQERALTLSGRTVSVVGALQDDGFVLSGVTRPQDFDLQLQLLAAHFKAPGWRPDGVDTLVRLNVMEMSQMEARPSGVFGLKAPALLHSGDPRWVISDADAIKAVTARDVRAFIEPIAARSPIVLSVVGDITVDRAIEAVARTFGAFQARPASPPRPGANTVKFPRGAPEPIVLYHKGRADQGLAYIAWPTTDFYVDRSASAAAKVLQLILQERVFDELRRAQGKTYSPQGDSAFSYSFPGYGSIFIQAEIAPENMAAFYSTIDAMALDLQTTEVSQDELDRARNPRVEYWNRTRATNAYWAGALVDAQTDPRLLMAIGENPGNLQRLTPADIRKAAQAWLVKDRSWRLTVTPETSAAVR